jgi:hypothetical protein
MEATKEDFNELENPDKYAMLGRRAFIDFTPPALKNAIPIDLIEEPLAFRASQKSSFAPKDVNNERIKVLKSENWTVCLD